MVVVLLMRVYLKANVNVYRGFSSFEALHQWRPHDSQQTKSKFDSLLPYSNGCGSSTTARNKTLRRIKLETIIRFVQMKRLEGKFIKNIGWI